MWTVIGISVRVIDTCRAGTVATQAGTVAMREATLPVVTGMEGMEIRMAGANMVLEAFRDALCEHL